MITREDLYKPGCAEISGFGGGYELCCRDMVVTGVNWCLENPEKAEHLSYKGFKNVFGLCMSNSPEAEELDKVLMEACEGSTGAQHQACISHIMWINAHTTDEYAAKMLEMGNREKD